MRRMTIMLFGVLLWGGVVLAQTREEWKTAKGVFAGDWVEKKTGRHLRIFFVEEWKLAEISDWRGDYYADHAMIDMYKASVKQHKLVMHEEKTEHRAPYAELVRLGDKLVYRWKAFGQAKGRFVDSAVFVRCSQ